MTIEEYLQSDLVLEASEEFRNKVFAAHREFMEKTSIGIKHIEIIPTKTIRHPKDNVTTYKVMYPELEYSTSPPFVDADKLTRKLSTNN